MFNKLWADALDTYDAGKCETAKSKLQSVLNIFPAEPDALRLMAASESCAAEEGVFGRATEGSTWLLYSAAGVVILAIAFLFILKQRQTQAAAPAVSMGPPTLAGPDEGEIAPVASDRSYGSIQVTAGSLSGKRFKITQSGLLVGTDASKCQIVFTETNISHEHAWIVPVENSVVVIDRGSTNGTYVNSLESPRVSKIGLQNGDRVYLGKRGSVVLTYFSS